MKLLVVGSGGREHAIAKKLLASPAVSQVFCAPGNAGMARDGIQLVNINQMDFQGLIDFVKSEVIAWVFVGPEQPLVAGITDVLSEAGVKVFGPSRKAAQIEGSKEFAKALMKKYEIPTGDYQVFAEFEPAWQYVQEVGLPIVLKADGLAEGKGVIIPETLSEAKQALREMLVEHSFGDSSARVVVEEFLDGEEFSFLAFVKGENVYPLEIAQDHKRVFEGDKGLNTGGMGAYCSVPQISKSVIDEAFNEILLPTVKAMSTEGNVYTGVLYAGLIATKEGPKVIEFNARMGDPETQVLLEHLDSDLAQIISDILEGREPVITWKENEIELGVVISAKGYPETYPKGLLLPDFSEVQDVSIYFSGVLENDEGKLVSNGGRVFMATGSGATVKEAQAKIYRELGKLALDEFYYRKDIGFKAVR